MGLPWVRLDTQFPSNPKILYLIEDKKFRAAFVWTASLAYSGAHGTDGFIPAAALPFLHASRADAQQLVDVRLWAPASGGWDINGWDEFQESSEETQKRKERAKKGAVARWEKEKAKRESLAK